MMKLLSKKHGFTLIELMVSVTLFVFLVLAMSSSIVSVIVLERQSRERNVFLGELYAFLDQVDRDVQLAVDIGCGSLNANCLGEAGGSLVLRDLSGNIVSYYKNGPIVERSVEGAGSSVSLGVSGGSITEFSILARGMSETDNSHPIFLIRITGNTASGVEVKSQRMFTSYWLDAPNI